MALYELGNCLRGYKSGYFLDDETAWRELALQFDQSFPSRLGRKVEMRKTIRHGRTIGGNETDADRKLREELELMLMGDRNARINP